MVFQNILVLSPHTDDAEIGCGGFISKQIADKKKLYYAAFSVCEDSLPSGFEKDCLEKEVQQAVKTLGVHKDNLIIYKHKVRSFPSIRQLILDELINLSKDIQPDLVVMPSINDYHQDHQVLAQETIRAFKTSASIISYELPWNHVNFNTQLFVRLSENHIQKKHDAMMNYKSQVSMGRPYFSKEFIFGLGKVRGAQCGSDYAEAFEVTRWMI